MLHELAALDRELFITLNNAGVSWLDDIMVLITGVAIWIPLYLGIAYLFFKHFKTADAVIFLALCILCVVLCDQGTVQLFKLRFERLRPCQVAEIRNQMRFLGANCGLYGFVSSHAANTFGFALLAGSILKPKLPKALPLLLIWAVIVSYSRIYVGVHYPGDILGGAIFGLFIARVLLIFAKRRQRL